MNVPPVIELSDVSLHYEGPPEVRALNGVSLRVSRGEFVAVVGPSGAGKSSLLHVLGLLTTPTKGHVALNGRSINDSDDTELTALRGQHIGFVFQAFHLIESKTAAENVALSLRYRGVLPNRAHALAVDALRSVGLGQRTAARVRVLSGGERQRVAIARALASDPDLILCDEPTGNLDSANGEKMLALLRDLHSSGRTVVVITHDDHVAAQAQRIIRLQDGKTSPSTPTVAESLPRPQYPRLSQGRIRAADLFDEALAGLSERPSRTALTVLGTLLGVATLVSILGLASTASGQISTRFDRLTATTVTAHSEDAHAYETEGLSRAAALNGVKGVAYLAPVDEASADSDPAKPQVVSPSSIPIVAASFGSWEVLHPHMMWGRTFDGALASNRVAVLGAAAARQLDIKGPLGTQSILISGRPYFVIGVFDDLERRTDLLLSIVVPTLPAERDWGKQTPAKTTELIFETAVGAGLTVASELPFALTPEAPSTLDVIPPPDPRGLREDVSVDLTGLFLALGFITLIVASVGIANTSLVAVLERIPEVGIRRALGASRSSIRTQFLLETSLVGLCGGILGALGGLIVVAGVSLWQAWTPIVDHSVVLLAPIAGTGVGALAGLLPARRAARVDPTVALRS